MTLAVPRRRTLLVRALGLAASAALGALRPTLVFAQTALSRNRPSGSGWPSRRAWAALDESVGGRLEKVEWPRTVDARSLANPYFISDQLALTQSSGWVGAWRCVPSAYAIRVERTSDVVAAVNFARKNRVRLVVRGGGHSYQGTSCAPDSLLLWMRPMRAVTLHDAFVAQGCDAQAAQPAVSIEAGALWMQVYDEVTTKGGRYVQGGGCATVGVAGLIQSGGFGSFSKTYGLAAAALIEAEVVTADGQVRVVNRCRDPELFWALKGGGGGTFGVVTRVTLRTRDLPATFGAVSLKVTATSDDAYRRLIARFVAFYRDRLFDSRWNEQAAFDEQNVLSVSMLFQGLTQDEARATWQPFLDEIKAAPADYETKGPSIVAIPARDLWNPAVLKRFPGVVIADDRPGAPEANIFWANDKDQPGQFHSGYRSSWLPASALQPDQQARLVEGLYGASRQKRVALHFNKGLAGAPQAEIDAARDTATNPAVLDAFALAIIAGEGPQNYPGLAEHVTDGIAARRDAARIGLAMDALLAAVPGRGSYVSESDYFESDWQQSFWGANFARLRAVKQQFDPDGLFIVHHGVGSEQWSADGFTRQT